MKHFVYIIESISSGIWYYGYSTDLEKRLRGHNNGLNVSTKGRGPWQFIFVREFLIKAEALAFERLLKKSKNKKYIRDKYKAYFLGRTPT